MDIIRYGYEIERFIPEIIAELSSIEKEELRKNLDKFLIKKPSEKNTKDLPSYLLKTPAKRLNFTKNKSNGEKFALKVKAIYGLCEAVLIYKAIDVISYQSGTSYRSFASTSVEHFSKITHEQILNYLSQLLHDA